mmetsp:Transcript_8129/g.13806  ORF Transcript_8129/g.13806 Transcript_8129/m.13806 type:complete len:233 (+) Transcript_8129:86-784(+)
MAEFTAEESTTELNSGSELSSAGDQTLSEVQFIQQLKLAAGIGIGYNGSDDDEKEVGNKHDLKIEDTNSNENNDMIEAPIAQPRRRGSLNIKDCLEKYRQLDQSMENKVYSQLLLPQEFVVKESLVWKRSGWSFKYRWLILTNLPRLFYTTEAGHFKGKIPWSMTEPISIVLKDRTHFDISIHSSSRIYHFNDKISGAEGWVTIINEISQCWQEYLTENAPEKIVKKKNIRR